MKHSIIWPPVHIAWKFLGCGVGAVAVQLVPKSPSIRLTTLLVLLVGLTIVAYVRWKRRDERQDHCV